MPQFRTKPVKIDAVQWNGKNQSEIHALCPGMYCTLDANGPSLFVKTLYKMTKVNVGDYVAYGNHGQLYVCEPDIFCDLHDPV